MTGNDPALLDRVRRLRDHGRSTKYEHVEIGFAERIDTLQAAILNAKLPQLERWTEARRSAAARYRALLADAPLELPTAADNVRHVYHLFVVRSPDRDALLARLRANGVGAGIHYPIPLHRQPAFLQLGYGDVTLPHTERAANEVLSLPIYPEITEAQQAHVAALLAAARA